MLVWDSANVAHIALHGVTPEEVEQVVVNHPFELVRGMFNGERRIQLVGETDLGRVLVVVITEEAVPRPVTAYEASRLRRFFLTQKVNGYGKGSRNT